MQKLQSIRVKRNKIVFRYTRERTEIVIRNITMVDSLQGGPFNK